MTDEDALFEVWFNIHRHDAWKRLYGFTTMPDGWSEGFKSSMREGWMGRASLHVVQATDCYSSCDGDPAYSHSANCPARK